MSQIKTVMKPKQVATIFENTFIERLDVYPSKLNLATCTPSDAGMDSFDTIEAIIALEDNFNIRIYSKEGDALMRAPLGNMLNICTRKLVEKEMLTAVDAKTIATNYVNLVKQNINNVNQMKQNQN